MATQMGFCNFMVNAFKQIFTNRISAAQRAVLLPQVDSFFAGRFIEGAIQDGRPFLASRLGWMEGYALGLRETGQNIEQSFIDKLRRHAGVFPATKENFEEFCSIYLSSFQQVDLLGLMTTPFQKDLVEKYLPNSMRCGLGSLEPYLDAAPWSRSLAGRRVLVVHAFSESIAKQYRENRRRIFADASVLPEFDLQCIKAPQTMLNETAGYSNWAEALEDLEARVAVLNFDVAIIGCGAYGLPLGAHIKKMGRVAIHFGGAVQLLFGISGKRWRDQPQFRALMTDAWVPPMESERPLGWEKIEEGCYW
jgi:hypothetical protein